MIGLERLRRRHLRRPRCYPLLRSAPSLVGLLESFSSYYASAFKEVIVFMVIIPVLLWRSFQRGRDDDEE